MEMPVMMLGSSVGVINDINITQCWQLREVSFALKELLHSCIDIPRRDDDSVI
jgi:hypothetical protein